MKLGKLLTTLPVLGAIALSATAAQPNVLIVLADDLGFSDLGSYGSEIETPNLDSLAEKGVRFSNFYNCARCWASRAALISGYYPQQMNADPPDRENVRRWSTPISTILKQQGYRAYHSGKWHIPMYDQTTKDGGFDQSYSLNDHNRFFYAKAHTENDKPLPPIKKGADYYATSAIADHMIKYLKQHQTDHSDQPFFGYLAFTSPHFPLMAPQETINKYDGKYDAGWDVLKQRRLDGLRNQGFPDWKPSAREPRIDAPSRFKGTEEALGPIETYNAVEWDTLSAEQKRYQSKKMQIHAAMIDEMDRAIGRVITQIRSMGALEDTLIMFMSDNGASAEILVRGDGHNPEVPMGSGESYLCLGPGFANLANAPLRRYKMWNHEGGISTPMIAFWPKGINPELTGSINKQPGHLVDVLPTIMNLIGINDSFRKAEAPPLPGSSFSDAFKGETMQKRGAIFFKHAGNRGMRLGDWKVVSSPTDRNKWELYNLKNDRAETTNLAAQFPEKIQQLTEYWQKLEDQMAMDAYPEGKSKTSKRVKKKPGSASVQPGKTGDITSSAKPYVFKGRQFARLGDTAALTLENSLTWELEAFIDAKAAAGSVLMGNRETPGHKTTFFKITPSKGVQLYKNGKQLLRIPATFPRNKWIKISVVKTGKDISVLCDGDKLGSAVLKEPVPAMPCYLGGDPNSKEYTHGQIRSASVK